MVADLVQSVCVNVLTINYFVFQVRTDQKMIQSESVSCIAIPRIFFFISVKLCLKLALHYTLCWVSATRLKTNNIYASCQISG